MADTSPDLDILAPERNLMAGLGARAATLPIFTSRDSDKAIEAAASKTNPDLQPMMKLKTALAGAAADALQIENETKQGLDAAKQKMQNVAAQREAQQYKTLVNNFGEVEKTAPELHPTKQNIQQIATMFSLIGLIGTAMGKGTGRNSAMNALSSMTGMMQGWQAGDQAKWKREVEEFDKNVLEFKNRLETAQRKYNMGLQQLAVDREAAKAEMDIALAELGSPLLKATAARQGYEAAGKALDSLSKDANSVYTKTGADKRHQEEMALQKERIGIEERRLNIELKKVGAELGGNATLQNVIGKRATTDKIADTINNNAMAVSRVDNLLVRLKDPDIVTGMKARLTNIEEQAKSLFGNQGEITTEGVNNLINGVVNPTDKNAVAQKDALFAAFEAERAAQGGRLTVQMMKQAGSALNPTSYTKEGYIGVLGGRRQSIINNLRAENLTDEDTTKLVNYYAKKQPNIVESGAPVSKIIVQTQEQYDKLPSGTIYYEDGKPYRKP
jgi:hypothetical protein